MELDTGSAGSTASVSAGTLRRRMRGVGRVGRESARAGLGPMGRADGRVKMARLVLRVAFRVLFRVRVIGLENVPARPVIVCANHLGWADAFLILLFLPVEPRIYALGDREAVVRNRFRERILNKYGVMVPLERDRPRAALQAMEQTLRQGGSLIIFPEGHLGPREGTIQRLQPGAARLAVQCETPLLPLGLTGSKELWLRRTLTVRIGAALEPDPTSGEPARERAQVLTAALDRALRTLLPGDDERPRLRPLRAWLTGLL